MRQVADFFERFHAVPFEERADYVWHLTPEEWAFVQDQIKVCNERLTPEERAWRETLPPMLLGRPVVVDG